MNPKKYERKYIPMTHQKRFNCKTKNYLKAQKMLKKSSELLLSRAKNIFEEMSFQARTPTIFDYSQKFQAQNWQKLSASRLFYVYTPEITYMRSKKLPFKSESLAAETEVLSLLSESNLPLKFQVQFCHPLYFFLSCQPDGVFKTTSGFLLLEVKTIFEQEGKSLNEMGQLFEETTDILKWKRQVQFSLQVSGIKNGLLIVWNWNKKCIVHKISIDFEENFFSSNYPLLTNFFIDVVFYDNSLGREVKSGLRQYVRRRLRALFEERITENRQTLGECNSSHLDQYFLEGLTRLFENN